MTVGIVGLGLIGGSFAKAYHEAGHRVLAFDTDQSVFDFAVLSGAVDGLLSEESLSSCDLILIAVYPSAAVDYLRQQCLIRYKSLFYSLIFINSLKSEYNVEHARLELATFRLPV